VVFHGHDHFFAKQDLDGIVYQECPVPTLKDTSYGFKDKAKYKHGVLLPNSGHLHVIVDPEIVKVDYIKTYIPGEGQNGEIAYSYIIEDM